MRYICAQHSKLYYAWQTDAMIFSFLQNDIKQEQIDIVLAEDKNELGHFLNLKKKYPNINLYVYEDTRQSKRYASSIRPHILKKHFKANPELYRGTFLYHDCDIALTKPLDLTPYLCGCNPTIYFSDTKSYLGYNYIKSKGQDVLDLMCKTINIDQKIVQQNEHKSGGCHYLFKDIDFNFWDQVEIDSEELFKKVSQLNREKKAKNNEYHELQIWCADMWAILWNLWKLGRKTEILKELDFTWSTSTNETWFKNSIYHNAGTNDDQDNKFHKAQYTQKYPPINLFINPKYASFYYYQLVQQALYLEKEV